MCGECNWPMNKWHKSSEKLPQQGTKILCCDKGDIFVAQRYGKYWFSIPYYDSKFSRWHKPEMWQEIEFPEGFSGKTYVLVSGEKLNIDELQKKEPKFYKEFVRIQLEFFRTSKNAK